MKLMYEWDINKLPSYMQDSSQWPVFDPQWTIIRIQDRVQVWKQIKA